MFVLEEIFITDPIERIGRLREAKIKADESFGLHIELHLRWKGNEEFDIVIFDCIVCNPNGYQDYIIRQKNTEPYFSDRAVIFPHFDPDLIYNYFKNHILSIAKYSRREQILKLMNRYDYEFDENDLSYDYLLQQNR